MLMPMVVMGLGIHSLKISSAWYRYMGRYGLYDIPSHSLRHWTAILGSHCTVADGGGNLFQNFSCFALYSKDQKTEYLVSLKTMQPEVAQEM